MTPDDLGALYLLVLLGLLAKRYGLPYPLVAALFLWWLINAQLSP
jgi:hypothetical protein